MVKVGLRRSSCLIWLISFVFPAMVVYCMLDSFLHTIYMKRAEKVNGCAPFFGSGLTSCGNRERICSVFLTQVIGHQQILFSCVNGNAPFSVRFRYSSHLSRNRWTAMLRFLGQFQANFQLTSGWIEPLLVGGYAPFSPLCSTLHFYTISRPNSLIFRQNFFEKSSNGKSWVNCKNYLASKNNLISSRISLYIVFSFSSNCVLCSKFWSAFSHSNIVLYFSNREAIKFRSHFVVACLSLTYNSHIDFISSSFQGDLHE